MSTALTDTVWHNDGHVMVLELNRAEVRVVEVVCPDGDECRHDVHGCVVRYFLLRFGLDCNVGVAAPAGEMPVAWTFVGDVHDLDAAQVWVIPTADEAFAAWLVTQQG